MAGYDNSMTGCTLANVEPNYKTKPACDAVCRKNAAQRCVFRWEPDLDTGTCTPLFEETVGACDGIPVGPISEYSRWTVCSDGACCVLARSYSVITLLIKLMCFLSGPAASVHDVQKEHVRPCITMCKAASVGLQSTHSTERQAANAASVRAHTLKVL